MFPDSREMSLARVLFHPLGFISGVVLSPLFAYAFGLPVAQHVANMSLLAIVVLLANIINELRKG